MKKAIKRILITLYCTGLIGGIGVAIVHPHVSNPAIASYNKFVTPNLKITYRYNPQYAYRFHPKIKQFIKSTTVRDIKHTSVAHNNPNINIYQKKITNLERSIIQNEANNRTLHKELRNKRTKILHKIFIRHHIKQNNTSANRNQQSLDKYQKLLNQTPKFKYQDKKIIRKHKVYHSIPYRIHHYSEHKIMYLNPNYPIWSNPYGLNTILESATNLLANDTQAVNVISKASNKYHTFYEIESSGHIYGWVSPDTLKVAHTFQMPFQYYSQLHPLYAPDACEAVSLRMALSVKGKDPSISMKRFINRIPRNSDPEKGYTKSPYKLGDSATIYPKALAKYGRHYDKHVYAFTGITKHHLIYELEHGNPIVYEGSYRMKDMDSDHTLVLIGYSNGELEFADPYYKQGENKPISWVSIHEFTKLFNQPLRGARAVVVK